MGGNDEAGFVFVSRLWKEVDETVELWLFLERCLHFLWGEKMMFILRFSQIVRRLYNVVGLE